MRLLKFFFLLLVSVPAMGQGKVIERKAKDTLTPILMDVGDTVKFVLRNGQVRTLVLLETDADVIITNLNELKKDQPGGATLYHFTCRLLVDGQPMKMERYVGSQESFYEPYVINGMRVWFDGVKDITNVIGSEHGGKNCECLPESGARFALADMTDRICPGPLHPWYDNKSNYISIADSYNGDDPWMGAYNGFEAHGGLDINMPRGTPNYTPIPIDDHYYFNSLAKGDNNNRWRGIHKWENGDVWTLQNHHVLNLRVPEHTPIEAGAHYVDAAGVHVGSHEHSHYVLKARTPQDAADIPLDAWILFWQTFEDNKEQLREVRASIDPVAPAVSGVPVTFKSTGSRPGLHRKSLSYYWAFGDGGSSLEPNPVHTFVKPGVYPVTLLVDDGARVHSFTQHITVRGSAIAKPSLALSAEDEPTFRVRPVHVMDVYGERPGYPHTLNFFARSTRPRPDKKVISLANAGGGTLSQAKLSVRFLNGEGWLKTQLEGKGNAQFLSVSVDASGLAPGVYKAVVDVECARALNPRQAFTVVLTVPTYPPADRETRDFTKEIVDNVSHHGNQFYATPYFWVGPRFHRWQRKGVNDMFLTNGGRAVEGEFARFTPDLEEGTYLVSFSDQTPFSPAERAVARGEQYPVNKAFNAEPRFAVKVKSKDGVKVIWMEPTKSTVIGKFNFNEGMDGYVEILAGGSTGQVLVDAIIFEKIDGK